MLLLAFPSMLSAQMAHRILRKEMYLNNQKHTRQILQVIGKDNFYLNYQSHSFELILNVTHNQ